MSIYPKGQCTDGAVGAAPWVQRYGNLGNALQWAANWRAHGGTVSSTPHVGDVFCCQPGDNYSGGAGHVGVVESVSGNSFTVKEMNFGPNGSGFGHYENGRTLHVDAGVSFLEQGAAQQPAPAPAPAPAPTGAGQYVHVDGPTADHIGRIHLFFKDAAGRMVPFGSEPMPEHGADPLYQWVPAAAPQHWRYVWVNGPTADRLHRANLFYKDHGGNFVPFSPAAGSAALYQRLPA